MREGGCVCGGHCAAEDRPRGAGDKDDVEIGSVGEKREGEQKGRGGGREGGGCETFWAVKDEDGYCGMGDAGEEVGDIARG